MNLRPRFTAPPAAALLTIVVAMTAAVVAAENATATATLERALLERNVTLAVQLRDASSGERFARDVIVTLIPAAKVMDLAFDPAGTEPLVSFLSNPGFAEQSAHPPDGVDVGAERTRFAAAVIAHATPNPRSRGRLLFDRAAFDRLMKSMHGAFCPLFPFCK